MLIRVRTIFILMFVFSFNVVLLANKSTNKYFPGTLDSYWVYEDQDGNEFTRRAIEGEEIAGKTFPAFSYEPELEDWTEYSPFIQPSLYNVSDAGITLVVGDEVEKAVKARLSKEMELVREIFTIQQPDDTDFNYEIKVEAHNHSYLLPTPVVLNEEWDVNNIKASLALDLQGNDQVKIDFTIIETGIVLDTETVETAAGKFEDCLKVEYRTETTAIISPIPSPDEIDPPGETVTTVWFAPNVGIVKVHQKMNYMFFDMVKDDGGLPKPPDPEPITFELKKYEIKTAEPEIKTAVPDSDDSDDSDDSNLGNESNPKYFPDTLESFWIYEDQDGNELTRRAIEGEEVAGKTFSAFSYEPELKDWAEYSPFIQPSLYNVSDAGITLVVSDEVEKAVKARLSKEMESFREIIRRDDPDAANFTYNIKAEAHKHSYLLPTPVVLNEEWDVNQIKANLTLDLQGNDQVKIDFTIVETGIILGTESVETAAGTFEDCLKVEYRTETTIQLNPPDSETNPPGETITTVWFAPGVGIVKFHQKMKYTFLEIIPDDADLPIPPDPEPITFELKKYEIKTAEPEIKTAVPDSDDSDDSDLGNESDSKYSPGTLASFWIYEDQDGNELTRRAIEGEEIAGKTFPAFSYEPELKDWVDYSCFIRPSLYQVSDAGITLVVGDEVEKAVKARLSKEMELLREIFKIQQPDDADFNYEIKVKAHNHSYLLPTPVVLNEEWDVNQIKASLALDLQRDEPLTTDYTINETGIIRGTETIKTAAGTFEDCLKVEYRTETTVIITPVPSPDEVDPPGETVTTVWFAPNVGIVKFNQKMNYTFLDMIKDDGGLEKPPDPEPITFELKKYEIKTAESEIKTAVPDSDDSDDSDDSNLGNESDPKYFPDTLASFWIYEDQDGNELTRRAIEGEEIAGQTFAAFSYEPELEDWAKYSPFIHPSLYNVSDAGITLVVGDEVEKAVKARLSEEMESLREIIRRDDPDSANFTYNIEVEAQGNSNLLPTPVTLNEEWDTNEIKASLALIFEGEEQIKIDYTIMETGIVKGTETVVAAAGTFEDCLKVEYRTETTAVLDPAELPDEMDPPGETVTTVWFAPDVGIVKFHQKMNYMFFDMFQDEFQDDGGLEKPPDPEPITFELKKYEIKAAEPEN